MSEYWDIYDENRKKTGKIVERGVYEFEPGEYHIVVTGIILNSKNEILITKRAEHKKFGLMWECNGGSVLAGETSLQGVIRELKEEVGVEFKKREAIFLKEVKGGKKYPDFKDLWLFRRDVKKEEITFPDGEAIDYKWVTIDEFMKMYNNKKIVPTVDFGVEEYNLALRTEQRKSYSYLDKEVNVKIDRPLNSKHPKHGFTYELNYGYIPNTTSGDGEELDCYVLGVEEPITKFTGKCIAVIHRLNDDDDKLIVVPEGKEFTDEEIKKLTHFQEQYFESEIIK